MKKKGFRIFFGMGSGVIDADSATVEYVPTPDGKYSRELVLRDGDGSEAARFGWDKITGYMALEIETEPSVEVPDGAAVN